MPVCIPNKEDFYESIKLTSYILSNENDYDIYTQWLNDEGMWEYAYAKVNNQFVDGRPQGYTLFDLVDNEHILDPEEKDGVVVAIEDYVKEPFVEKLVFFNKVYKFKRLCRRMKDGTCFCIYSNPTTKEKGK